MNAWTPTVSLSLRHSASGISSLSVVRTHDQRCLDTTLRRFPHLLSLCRDFPPNDAVLREVFEDRVPLIIAEYRRVVGKG